MARDAVLRIKMVVDAAQAQAGLTGASGKVSKFGGAINKMVGPALAAGTALIGLGAAALKSASRTEQAMGGLDAVFGANADVVKGWAANAADAVGLSSAQYGELAGVIGAQLKNMGVPMDEIAGKTNDLVTMGADLAATYGGTTADAVEALGAALRGEADPAERYGLALSQAAVKAKMAEQGTSKLTGAAGKQAKTAALLALATEQAGGAMGQFARESDSASGSSQIAAAQWENAKSALGEALLPAAVAVAGALATVAKWMSANAGPTKIILGIIAALTVAVLVVAAAQWVWNAALFAFPGTWIVLAIVAVVVAVVILWNKCAAFRNAMKAIWGALKVGWAAVVSAAKAVAAAFVAAWNAVISAFGRVKAVVVAVASAVKSFFVGAWRAIMSTAKSVAAGITAGFRAVANAGRAVANAVRNAFRAAWSSVRSAGSSAMAAVRSAIARIASAARSVANTVKSVFRNAWTSVKSAASTAINGAIAVVRRLLAPVRTAANTIKTTLAKAFNAVKSAASGVGTAIKNAFSGIAGVINGITGAVKNLISAISRVKSPKVSIPKIGGKSAPAPAGLATAGALTVPGPRAAPKAAATGGTVVNVYGALDPERVARQIRDILAGADARRHGVRVGLRTAS